MNIKYHCKYCGISFRLNSEITQLYNDGLIPLPDECDVCSYEGEYQEFENFSDADPGL